MTDNDDTLATASLLADTRLAVLNGERVPVEQLRALYANLRRDRENARRASASERRAVKSAERRVASRVVSVDDLFAGGGQEDDA